MSDPAAIAAEVNQLRNFMQNNPPAPQGAGAAGPGSGGYNVEELQDGRIRLTSSSDPTQSITVTRQAAQQYQQEEDARNAAATKLKDRQDNREMPRPRGGAQGVVPPVPPAGQPLDPLWAGAAGSIGGIAGAVMSGAISGMTTSVALSGASATGSIAGSPLASNGGPEITVNDGPANGVNTGR